MSRPLVTGLLAACCLLAVVVGGAVATDATAERSIPEEVEPGDTVTFTTTIERDHGGPVDYSEQFDPRFDHARITSITLDGDQFIPLFTEVRGDSLLIITNTLEAGSIEVTVEVGIPDDAEPGDQFEFDGDYRVETGTDPVPVTGDSVLTIVEPNDGSTGSNGDDSSGDNGSSGGSGGGASDDTDGDDESAGDDETTNDGSGEGTDDQDDREPTDADDSSDEDDATVEDSADGDDEPVTEDSSDASADESGDDPEGDTDEDTTVESTQSDEEAVDDSTEATDDDELGVSLVGPLLAVALVVFALRLRLE